jgi:formylglycine-generating enzyme required for sulfatase activity
MRLVPAGEFNMGSEHGEQQEAPLHTVYLAAYYIDKYEVTNSLYKACVDAEACDLPKQLDLYNSPSYAEHPVVNVDWFMASAYCEWRAEDLPTEAQWEKAARGTDERTYPWGNELTCADVIFLDNRVPQQCNNGGGTIPVGTNPNNVSPYGAYDMAGNVWEWVADWWDTQYYAVSPHANPIGPTAGEHKVVRGGSWNNLPIDLRTTTRNWDDQFFYHFLLGFRCTVDVTLPNTRLAAGT